MVAMVIKFGKRHILIENALHSLVCGHRYLWLLQLPLENQVIFLTETNACLPNLSSIFIYSKTCPLHALSLRLRRLIAIKCNPWLKMSNVLLQQGVTNLPNTVTMLFAIQVIPFDFLMRPKISRSVKYTGGQNKSNSITSLQHLHRNLIMSPMNRLSDYLFMRFIHNYSNTVPLVGNIILQFIVWNGVTHSLPFHFTSPKTLIFKKSCKNFSTEEVKSRRTLHSGSELLLVVSLTEKEPCLWWSRRY